MAKGDKKIPSDIKAFMRELIREVLSEEKADRCLRIARRKYDKPSAYRSGAIVRCRKGDIWKDLKEDQNLDQLPKGKIFDDAKNIEGIFQKSKRSWNEVIEAYEKYKEHQQPTTINIQDIKITQPNIQANKVKNMLDKIDKLPPINVVEFEDGEKVIFDAHHRLVANWVLGRDKLEVNLVKIHNLQEDESLHKWFNRRGGNGEKGWVDCNTCREVDGKTKCKPCGRKEGEKRAKYPSCRPTPAGCKDKGKGKTWGKTK